MLVIGLTGPSGAGKSEVAKRFASYGIPVLDADRIYHDLLTPPSGCLTELCDAFGARVLNPDGTLDRRALGEIVFNDPQSLERLNAISHRYVMEEIRRKLEKLRREQTRAAVLDAPQLFEAGADRECNVIVSVLADRALRLERIMLRDQINAETAMKRVLAQKSDEFFRAHSDYIVSNEDNPEALLPQVERILTETGVLQP